MKTIIELALEHGVVSCGHTDPEEIKAIEDFAAEIKAARDAELLAGVEMPEPSVQASSIIPRNGIYGALYTAEQLRDYAAAAVAKKDAEIALQEISDFGQMQELLAERDALKAENERLRAAAENMTREVQSVPTELIKKWKVLELINAAMKGQP